MLGKHEFTEWERRVKEILSNVEIPWELHLQHDKMFKDDNGNGRLYIQIQFEDVCNVTGDIGYKSYCRKFYLSPHMTTQEIVRTAWLAYQGAVLHEASEKFKYMGKMINGPHISPDALVEVAHRRDVREGEQPKREGFFDWATFGAAITDPHRIKTDEEGNTYLT